MELDPKLVQYAFIALIALSVGGMLIGLLFPYFTGQADVSRRVRTVADRGRASQPALGGIRARLTAESKDSRRKQIAESLKQFEVNERARRKKLTLRQMITQAGLDITPQAFFVASAVAGLATGFATLLVGAPWFVSLAALVAGTLGLPRWVLRFLAARRRETFLREFADAIDIMVRGLKAGLPVTDAMKVIASETPPPVGPEFLEVVEGQRIGITIEQGIERMYERMPLAEVNFLAIVMAIQAKTGGNLAEALNNLSKVLRDRKKMKMKIQAVSQEAKASAMIIGSLPFVITAGMTVLNPEYLIPLWTTPTGQTLLVGSGVWMTMGVLIMRKMINFDI